MKSPFLLSFLILALMGCWGSGREKTLIHSVQGETMGTTYSLKLYTQDSVDLEALKKEAESLLKRVNQEMSTYISDSLISQFNQSKVGQWQIMSEGFYAVTSTSLAYAQKTGGWFDPTLGPLVNLWGFGPNGQKKVPSAKQVEAAKKISGFRTLLLDPNKKRISKKRDGVYLDLSASAKGYGVDQLSGLLSQKGFHHHLVEIGGELRAKGSKGREAWQVAIERPSLTTRKIQQVLDLRDQALATSGSYRNFYKSKGSFYSHTINPKTGRPVTHNLVSVSVIHNNCMEADILATAFMSMGYKAAKEFSEKHRIAALFIQQQEGEAVVDASSTFPQRSPE